MAKTALIDTWELMLNTFGPKKGCKTQQKRCKTDRLKSEGVGIFPQSEEIPLHQMQPKIIQKGIIPPSI